MPGWEPPSKDQEILLLYAGWYEPHGERCPQVGSPVALPTLTTLSVLPLGLWPVRVCGSALRLVLWGVAPSFSVSAQLRGGRKKVGSQSQMPPP